MELIIIIIIIIINININITTIITSNIIMMIIITGGSWQMAWKRTQIMQLQAIIALDNAVIHCATVHVITQSNTWTGYLRS